LTSPYDPDYLFDLLEEILKLPTTQQLQILLRRAPVDLSGRFNKVVEQYPNIIKVADPLWSFDGGDNEHWTLVYPTINDVKLLVNIAYHCDAVYNVGSTMAHDFAMFNKPAMYINYDQPHAKGWSVETIYKFQHFRSMKGLDAVTWINSKNEIKEVLKKVLETPEKCSTDRKKWLEIVTGCEKNVSKKIVDVLLLNGGDK